MRQKLWFLFLMLPSLALADGWAFRLGIAQFPKQDNTLLGLEAVRMFDLTKDMDLGVGLVVRTDFSQTVGPGVLARYRYWLIEQIAVGAVTEYGYMLNQSTSSPNSYSYYFLGPLLALRVKPLFVQWEPGFLFFQGTSEFMPLRFAIGLIF